MQELILKKKNEYLSIRGSDPQLRKWLKDSDLWHWLYTVMRLTGKPVSRRQILDLLGGALDENLPLNTYEFVHGCAAVHKDMEASISMQSEPDLKMLQRWYEMAFGKDFAFRRNNPVVYQWNFVPPHFYDVKELTETMLRRYAGGRNREFPVQRALDMALELFQIYPFGDETFVMAWFLLMYELTKASVPVPSLNVGEQEFNDLVAAYLSRGNKKPIEELFENGVLERLDAVISVCRQAAEVQ